MTENCDSLSIFSKKVVKVLKIKITFFLSPNEFWKMFYQIHMRRDNIEYGNLKKSFKSLNTINYYRVSLLSYRNYPDREVLTSKTLSYYHFIFFGNCKAQF